MESSLLNAMHATMMSDTPENTINIILIYILFKEIIFFRFTLHILILFVLPLNALKKVIRRLIEAHTGLLQSLPSLSSLSRFKHGIRHNVNDNSIIRHSRSVKVRKDKYKHIEKSIAALWDNGYSDRRPLQEFFLFFPCGRFCFIEKQKLM